MKSIKSWLILIPLIGLLLASCSRRHYIYIYKPPKTKPVHHHHHPGHKKSKCFDEKRHDKYDFKSKIKLPDFMQKEKLLCFVDLSFCNVELNEKAYMELLGEMPPATMQDAERYLKTGYIPKGYEPRNVKLFMKKLETDRVRMLLDSKDSEMRNLGMLMIGAHVKEYYPVNSELMEKNREKMNEKDYIKFCIMQLAEI